MLGVVHPVVGAAPPQQDPLASSSGGGNGGAARDRTGRALQAAGVTARLARAHPGHGAGLPTLLVLAALVMVGWQAWRLLRGRRSLTPSGLAVQSGILMASIAVATQNLAAGLIGIVLACAVLAGWGRLAKAPGRAFEAAPVAENAPPTIEPRRSGSAASYWWS